MHVLLLMCWSDYIQSGPNVLYLSLYYSFLQMYDLLVEFITALIDFVYIIYQQFSQPVLALASRLSKKNI